MSLEQIQNPPEEESLGLKVDSETTQEQAESFFGKALKCFKKWTNLGITVVSVYVVGEKLIESEGDFNTYKESVVATLSAEELKVKDEQNEKIEAIFGQEVVSRMYFSDMQAYFQKQNGDRVGPEVVGFDENEVKYGITENYFLYPKGWINGEMDMIRYNDKKHNRNCAGYFYTGNILFSSRLEIFNNSEEPGFIGSGVLEHELGHANDWMTDMDLNIVERQQLLLLIHDRLNSSDRYQSDYYSSFINGTKEGLHKSASEYWAEICEQYFTNPKKLLEKHPVDFQIVDKFAKKNDPSFDIFNKDRGAFDTQTGKLKDVWVGK